MFAKLRYFKFLIIHTMRHLNSHRKKTMFTRLQNYQDAALCLVRVVTGYMFLQHGLAKFFEFPVSMTGGHGAVPLFSLFGVGGVLELAGGVLLMLGLFTRPVAFLLAG